MKRPMSPDRIYFRTPTIPSALEFRREAYGWTQARMAKALGIGSSHYSEIVNGKRDLPYSAACLAYEVGVPASVLLKVRRPRAGKREKGRKP